MNSTVPPNSTAHSQPDLVRASISGMQLVAASLGTLIVLPAALHPEMLQSAFNYYIINILLGNTIAILHIFFYFIIVLHGRWIFSGPVCQLYMTITYLAFGVVANLEFLISFNRLWAVFLPHHYRRHHTKTVALALCLGVWVMSFGITVPFILLTGTSYNGKDGFCRPKLGALPDYTRLLGAYMYAPVFLMLLSYPVLWRKLRTIQRVGSTASKTVNRVSGTMTLTSEEGRNTQVRNEPDLNSRALRRRKREASRFLVLSVVFVCALLFWTPRMLPIIFPIPQLRDPVVTGWLIMWSFCTNCLEPWVFVVTLPELRDKVRNFYRIW